MVAALEKSVASEASEESEDFEASDAYEESVQKGRETTELLTVCLCMDKPTNLLWRYVFMLRCNVTGHLDLELGPQAKGSQCCPCKSPEKPKVAKNTSCKPRGAKAMVSENRGRSMSWHITCNATNCVSKLASLDLNVR